MNLIVFQTFPLFRPHLTPPPLAVILSEGARRLLVQPLSLMPDKSNLPRWTAIVGLFGIGAFCINKAVQGEHPEQYLAGVAGAILCIVIGLFLLVPDVFAMVGRLVNSFFFPGGKSSKPVLSYKLPDFYRRKKRYEESVEEYQRILHYYPCESRAWMGVIEVQMVDLHDPEAARQTYKRALHKLRKDRIALEDVRNCWAQLLATPPPRQPESDASHAIHAE